MSFNYPALTSTARAIIKEFGALVVLQSRILPNYDPATGTATPTYVSSNRLGVIFDFGVGQTLSFGGLIQKEDKRLILEAGVAPLLQDRIIADNVEYVIKGVGTVSPANYPVMYDLHLGAG